MILTHLSIAFLFFIALLSLLLTLLFRHIAIKYSVIDIPNNRSSHSIPTPRGGGIAVIISLLCGMLYFYFNNQLDSKLFWSLILGIPLSIIGFIDDIYNLKPGIRFSIQFITAISGLLVLGGIKNLAFGFFTINSLLLIPLSIIAIIWCINLFNFLDGIDGYIGMEIIFIGLAVFLLTNNIIGLLIVAAILGFLILNWQPAKIFMGDVGSTYLGYTVAIIAIYFNNNDSIPIINFLILTSVFWLDATITLLRRIRNKENLSQAHRKHAYQRIVQAGWSHQKTVFFVLILNIFNFALVLLASKYKQYLLAFLFFNLIILYFAVHYVDKKKPFMKS